MTATTIPVGRTYERLSNTDNRKITTTWATSLVREDDAVNGVGKIQVNVETRFNKARKRLESSIFTDTLSERGFAVRSFTVFADPTADFGLTIDTAPLARFSRKAAVEFHAAALARLEAETVLVPSNPRGEQAAKDLTAAWAARV